MNKKIGLFTIALMSLIAVFIPEQAQAAKVRIQPTISFNNTYTHAYPTRVYAVAPPIVHHYTYYSPYGPYEQVIVQEPIHYYVPPQPVMRSQAVKFGLHFNL